MSTTSRDSDITEVPLDKEAGYHAPNLANTAHDGISKEEEPQAEVEPVTLEKSESQKRIVIGFEPGDPGNPFNWSMVR